LTRLPLVFSGGVHGGRGRRARLRCVAARPL